MADKREVFTIVEDNSTGEGIKLPGRVEGDASGSNHMPAMVAKDASGNYKLLETRDEGAAISGVDAQPVINAKDLSGNFKYHELRLQGAVASGVTMQPALVAKDSSGNLAMLPLNSDGELIVSNDAQGTKKSAYAKTAAVVNTVTTAVNLALTISKTYEDIQIRSSSSSPVFWELVQVDDATLTVLDSWFTSSGQYTWSMAYDHLQFTSGASGTQQLRLRGTQLQSSASDMHGYVSAFEKA